jgi:hypothetical protein
MFGHYGLWFPTPPFSPDLAPCDFFSFVRMKLLTSLHKIPIRQFQECWIYYINTDRDYFEGENNEQ